jgi:ketosteroid isomerase-like protein
MTEADDLDAIREGYRAWNEGDAAAFMHPEIEWITPAEVPGGGTFRGERETAGFLRNFEGTKGVLDLSFQVEEILPAGDEYLVVSLAEGTSASGVAIPAHHWFHLIRLEDGKVRRAELFLDRDQALEAAGLSA